MKIGLWAFFGAGNLGDVSIQQAVIDNLRARVPEVEIVAVCLGPADVQRRFGIAAYPIYSGEPVAPANRLEQGGRRDAAAASGGPSARKRSPVKRIAGAAARLPPLRGLLRLAWRARAELRYLPEMRRLVRSLDMLVISGSGVFDDTWRGRWLRPFTLYKWCLIAKLANTRLVFMSVGATSLKTRPGRYFAKKALRLAAYRSFRDEESLALARRLGVRRRDGVLPDLAYSLDVRPFLGRAARTSTGPDRSAPARAGGGALVGVGPIPYCAPGRWPEENPAQYDAYIGKLAALLDWLLAKNCRIRFVVTHERSDPLAAAAIIAKLEAMRGPLDGRVANPVISTVDALMDEIAATDYMITSRFHGVLLPYLLGKPVIALSYDTKLRNLMSAVDQERYCLPIRDFDTAAFQAAFEDMTKNAPALARKLHARREACNQALEAQYKYLFGPLP